ncbi:MAG: hypothetical protein KGJ80_02715 [Chloroflexota bacterium]|nr:hypothetical protein [Chloroflexota bacterium]
MKLKAADCGIVPLTDWDVERFKFAPDEIERMARMERQRFGEERIRAGWTYTPRQKNLEGKIGPNLVPWDALSESEKEKTRNTVRGLPVFLARAGFQVWRSR